MNKAMSACLVCLSACAGAHAQTSPLYALDDYSGATLVIQGGVVVQSFVRSDPLYTAAVAIAGDVRTVGHGNGATGTQYTLAGSPLGGTYTNTTGTGAFYDGGTDGTNYNFSFRSGTNELWRFDRNWQNGQVLFHLPGVAPDTAGVTYDSLTGGFFISGYTRFASYNSSGGLLWSRGHEGGVLAQFGIAYDRQDDTVWTSGNLLHPGWLQQYTSGGVFIQQVYVPQLSGMNALGLEFNVPGPGAAGLFAVASLVGVRRRR